MEPINASKRSIGVNFNAKEEAEIVLWAPLPENLSLYLPASDRLLPLNKSSQGYWELTTTAVQPGDLYKFLLNDEKSLPDPVSLLQPQGVHGPSEAVDINKFRWTDDAWQNIPLEHYIIYELHTGTFSPGGDFAGIEKKLDYLVELGITAIELMPVAAFPGTRNWGYDGVYPFAVQQSYGGPEAFQHLVNACHNKGLAVILDVVYNHVGPEGNYLREFGPCFTDKYCTPWGEAINLDDAGCDGVRHYLIDNVLMWLRDFHVDALRMDAVHALKDFSAQHILLDIREWVDRLMQSTGRTHYLLIECDLNDSRFINSPGIGGYGMDAQWLDEFHHALRTAAGEKSLGYYSDFNGLQHLAKAYQDAYVYDGIYSEHRQRTFGNKAEGNTGSQFVVFSQNHDQIGNRMNGERSSELFGFEMQKLMAGAVMVSPYLPLIFMGEEYSEPHPFLYFVDPIDPELAKTIRESRRKEFAAFHIEGEAPDPVSEETFARSRLQWELIEQLPYKTMLDYYKTLITARKQHPALNRPDRQRLKLTVDPNTQTLTLLRWQEESQLICLMNFSPHRQELTAPAKNAPWQKILDSADNRWGGPGGAPDQIFPGSSITLQPESILLYD